MVDARLDQAWMGLHDIFEARYRRFLQPLHILLWVLETLRSTCFPLYTRKTSHRLNACDLTPNAPLHIRLLYPIGTNALCD